MQRRHVRLDNVPIRDLRLMVSCAHVLNAVSVVDTDDKLHKYI